MNLIDIDDAIINNLIYVKPTHHSVLAEGIVLANQAASRKRSLNQKIGFLNEEIHFGFDYEWFLRILKTSNPYILIKYGVIFGGGREETKTAKFHASFDEEFLLIRKARESTMTTTCYYHLQGLFLLLLKVDWSYALRGISRRLSGK